MGEFSSFYYPGNLRFRDFYGIYLALKMTEPSKVLHIRNVGHEISEVFYLF